MHRRFVLAITAALGAIVFVSASVAAQWPTTCVELNDIVEAHLGNSNNVGIYQRVFGGQAEQACQNDHREDVRATFAWAIGSGNEPAMQPAPAPASSPQSHPDYERVRQVTLARGADEALAANVAAVVVTQGNVDSYLRGTLAGVAYGEHGCVSQSPQCPLAPVAQTPAPTPPPVATTPPSGGVTCSNLRWQSRPGQLFDLVWQVTVRNGTGRTQSVYIEVQWLDANGFQIQWDNWSDEVGAGQTRQISETDYLPDGYSFSDIKSFRVAECG